MEINVHDILFLYSNEAIEIFEKKPAWLLTDKMADRLAVVRRLKGTDEKAAIGFRGADRSKRLAAFTPIQNIKSVIRPTDVLQLLPAKSHQESINLLKNILQDFEWGIGGSVGFTMATGISVCHEQSDIDVIIYLNSISEVTKVAALKPVLAQCINKLDIQMEIRNLGGIILEDYINHDKFIIRTPVGPVLFKKSACHAPNFVECDY